VDLGIEGKHAAVAAASSGLGFAVARTLAEEGVAVAICSRDRDRISRAALAIGGATVPIVCDVSTAAGGRQFIEEAIDAMGGIDILVANGAGPPAGNFGDTPTEAYPGALEQSIMSVIAMCKGAVPAMQSRGWGRVVAITSITARQPAASLILSNTARAGLTGFLRTLALEVAEDGVTVNAVQPGPHDTARVKELGPEADPAALGIRTGCFGDPADLGAIVAMLCSTFAKFIIGAQLPVDGGNYVGLQ
jgi:3-oxoacyl-[acyl-carrier protein] reductase